MYIQASILQLLFYEQWLQAAYQAWRQKRGFDICYRALEVDVGALISGDGSPLSKHSDALKITP